MNKIKQIILFGIAVLMCSCQSKQMEPSAEAVSVPLGGNTYVTAGKESAKVSTDGIKSWTGTDAVLSAWFKTSQPGDLNLFLKGKAADGPSTVKVTFGGKSFTVKVTEAEETVIPVGKVSVTEPGYIRVDLQGEEKEGAQFANISELLIDGPAAQEPLYLVRNFEPYWGMRGPSVHMKYTLPEESVEYFYNEITVPEGEDKIGSYFMTNGFGEGYCGIQANSDTERRVLFSVWSPFETDDPKAIPEDHRIKLLAQGKDVHIGEFGNEGSGGQSYLKYPWKAGQTYRVITRVHPDGKGNTAYYAWFFAPEEGEWRLIAGFCGRRQTHGTPEHILSLKTLCPAKVIWNVVSILETNGPVRLKESGKNLPKACSLMMPPPVPVSVRIMPVGWKIICSSSVTAVSSMIIQSSNPFLHVSRTELLRMST